MTQCKKELAQEIGEVVLLTEAKIEELSKKIMP